MSVETLIGNFVHLEILSISGSAIFFSVESSILFYLTPKSLTVLKKWLARFDRYDL